MLRQSFDMLLAALGNDREAVGDAIYGLKIHALTAVKADYRPRMAWNGYIYIYYRYMNIMAIPLCIM